MSTKTQGDGSVVSTKERRQKGEKMKKIISIFITLGIIFTLVLPVCAQTNIECSYTIEGNTISKVTVTEKPYKNGMTASYTISGTSNEDVALYEYNCYNQLVGLNTNGVVSSYNYAPDGLRYSKTVGADTTAFVYDNANIIEEINSDGINKYYRGIEIIKNDDDLYYIYNGQGDVSILTDNSGTTIADYTFDAYGNQQQENTVYNPFGYRGEYTDSESGLIYLRARMYDPETGRFINEDPIKDGYNWYIYCAGNPVMFVDPSGLIIKLSKDATTEHKKQYEVAINYLKGSKTAQKLIEKLEKSNVVFTVMFVDSSKNSQYEYATNNIIWSNRGGLVGLESKEGQSPALSLAHEMGHAAQHLDGELNKYIQSKSKADKVIVEESNVTKYETPIAKELGEPTRTSYYNQLGKRVMNNSIHYITKIYRGWLGFKKYEVHHNKYPILGTSLSHVR